MNEDVGLRVDKFLGSHPEIGSRSKAEHLIEVGAVTINGKAVKSSYRICAGDQIRIEIPAPETSQIQALDLPLDVVYEDGHLLVINKPPGLVVHPAAGHQQDTLVNALVGLDVDFDMQFGENRPGIVHRLDKDTSGLLVVAKTSLAQERLVSQFKSRSVQRRYQALVWSPQLPQSGSIQSYLGRNPNDRKKFASVRDSSGRIIRSENVTCGGKWAKTHFATVHSSPSGLRLLQLKLETGRTHQIRVHLSEFGAAIVADPIYGKPIAQGKLNVTERSVINSFPRLALHAFELGFRHPVTDQPLLFKVDWPTDILPALQELRLWKAIYDL